MFPCSSVTDFAPEVTHHPWDGGVQSGRLAGSRCSPARSSGGAREPCYYTGQKKVEETTWRRWSWSLCCLIVLNISDFLALVILKFPPSFRGALKRLVIPVFCFSVFCDLRGKFQYLLLPVFLWPAAIWETVQQDCRIFISKHHI